ncbi:MAG: transglutaminase-like domain-containing protein, partial [Clostridiales bacterium]
VKSSPDVLSKVGVIYKYVIKNYTYNTKLAATVTSGYLPNLDAFFDKKSGICFDYAALMTAMLRSQNIPTKLVVGYTGKAYHAWISVYTEAGGWLDNVIFFNGAEWKLMDPTFASSSKSSESIMKYIGNGENYSAKYLY